MDYTIYVKTTNSCNMACKHCYNTISHDCCSMTDEVLDKTIAFIRMFYLEHSKHVVNVQLHGGEPMLYDLAKLNKLVDETNDLPVKWSVTTNLTYKLTREYTKFFKKMKPYDDIPFIMTSWDYKIRFNGNEEQIWKDNVKRVIKNKIKVQPIVTVTKDLIANVTPIELFDMFIELGISDVNFERLTETGRASDGKLTPDNADVDKWLFDAYIASKEKNIHIPLFESIEDSTNGFLNGCRARNCMNTVITINPTGKVSACPNTANVEYGVLTDDGHIIENKSKHLFLCMKESNKEFNCIICKYFKYCNAECCQLKHDKTGCPGLKSIYKYILENK